MNKFYEDGRGMSLNSIRTLHLGFLCFMLFFLSDAWAQSRDHLGTAEGQTKVLRGEVLSRADSKPIAGVSLGVNGNATSTDELGKFQIERGNRAGTVEVRHMGFETQFVDYKEEVIFLTILLEPIEKQIEEVEVVSTGYQQLPKERATGSFVQIDNELLNRRVSTNLLDRLEGVTSGLNFNTSSGGAGGLLPFNEQTGIAIRGRVTIDEDVSADPLIILDNFPFEGGLDHINPNDVESITILRDAAAASIWGARSGNGVIVITTKKAALGEKTKVDFNSSVTISRKPNLKYSRNFIPSAEFMGVERLLFDEGFYDADLANTSNYPVVSPYVELLERHKNGDLQEQELQAITNRWSLADIRDEVSHHFYQGSQRKQYALGIQSGGMKSSHYFSLGYDNNREPIKAAGLKRVSINFSPRYQLLPNLSFAPSVLFTQSDQKYGYSYRSPYPYVTFMDENGSFEAVPAGYRASFLADAEKQGFKDWTLRPLLEQELKKTSLSRAHLLLRSSAKYDFSDWASLSALFQYEREQGEYEDGKDRNSYDVRNLVNRFTQTTGSVWSYPIPDADILDYVQDKLEAFNFRLNVNIDKEWSEKHRLNVLLGAEMKSSDLSSMSGRHYGYDKETGTVLGNLNFNQYYSINPSGSQMIDDGMGQMRLTTRRFISYFGNAAYQFKNRYTLSASARQDGANLYGAHTNHKFVPLWSVGFLYDLASEGFYKSALLPELKFRMTYGFNGNSYNHAAYLIASFNRNTVNGFRQATIQNPPNPSLRWERVKNINFSVEFASKGKRISGHIDFYKKNGLDLIEEVLLRPSSGFESFKGNSAQVRTTGMDLQLNSINSNGRLKWKSVLLLSKVKDKVISFGEEYPTSYLVSNSSSVNGAARFGLYIKEGNSLYGVYSYRSAGLDQETGDPRGYLNGEESTDYTAIIASNTMDNVIYHGSSRPTHFGSLRNIFSYGSWSVSVNVLFKGGHYFRKRSSSINLTEAIRQPNADFMQAFRLNEDARNTDMPSMAYPNNDNRNVFYQNSEALVLRGDHIRLQDVSLSYAIALPWCRLDVYSYVDNLGIIWRKNNWKIDPDINDYSGAYPAPISYALGVRCQF